MKSEFEIEDEGEDVISEEEQNRQTQLFIDYIKGNSKKWIFLDFLNKMLNVDINRNPLDFS